MDKLKILYDGECIVCAKEIIHYKKIDQNNVIEVVDISDPSFDAESFGLTSHAVQLHMHAIDSEGKVHKGVDAFIAIWKRVPRYNFLVPIFSFSPLKPLYNFGYNIFAHHIRPRLPKKKRCIDGSCPID